MRLAKPQSPAPPLTFTQKLRARVADRMNVCPTCGQPRATGGCRALAAQIGVNHTTLWRFLSGKAPSGQLVDKLVAYLDKEG